MVLSEGPITPPISPSPSDHPMDEVVMQESTPSIDIPAEYPATPVSMPPQTPVSMDEDESAGEEPAVPIIRQPTRSLSDENIHLSSATETLKLTDFDVRGTLGNS